MPEDIFDLLQGNRVMKAINAELVPIMIATEGTDFYDKNNTEKAAESVQTTLRISLQLRNSGGSGRTHYLGHCVVKRLK